MVCTVTVCCQPLLCFDLELIHRHAGQCRDEDFLEVLQRQSGNCLPVTREHRLEWLDVLEFRILLLGHLIKPFGIQMLAGTVDQLEQDLALAFEFLEKLAAIIPTPPSDCTT